MENAIAITRNKQELENLEAIIERGLSTFYEVGHALMRIRDEELYEKVRGISNFKTYCKDRWGMSIRHAERLMGSAAVVENTRPIGRVPDSESVARVISSLLPEQQCATWQKAVETAPEGKVTSSLLWVLMILIPSGPLQ